MFIKTICFCIVLLFMIGCNISEPTQIKTDITSHNKDWFGLCSENSVKNVRDFFRAYVEFGLPYRNFNFTRARIFLTEKDMKAHVSYQKDGHIYWTRKPLIIKKGEVIITDGYTVVRGFCCNQISMEPKFPTTPDEPPEYKLQPRLSTWPVEERIPNRITTLIPPSIPPLEPDVPIVPDSPLEPSIPEEHAPFIAFVPIVDRPFIERDREKVNPVPESRTFILLGTIILWLLGIRKYWGG